MESSNGVVYYIFIIFTGSALLATLALYARQALLVGYIVLGVIVGPPVLGLVGDMELINGGADIGIIFLLFLLGLHLEPQDLIHLLKKTTVITLLSSLVFGLLGFVIGWVNGFTFSENIIIGATAMFSSTIIGLKLLPTTVLHHRHAGEIIISVLLLQDLIAILTLLLIEGAGRGGASLMEIGLLMLNLPLLVGFGWVVERYLLVILIRRFDKIQEYIFLMTIGWCLGMAELATLLNLSHEIGAFIGGVLLATSPIARFIAESLKPLRDFFLVLFFFSLGAALKLDVLYTIIVPALILAMTLLLVKPWIFKVLLVRLGEQSSMSWEVGWRLGQISEFALMIAVVANEAKVIGESASYLIQAATIITFVVSSYLIVMYYPTPIAVSDRLRRD